MDVDHLECRPEPACVREARLFVVDRLQDWHADDLVDSAALLTSELATNAVLHTRRPFSVSVRRSGSGIRVEVVDGSEDLPRLRTPVSANGSSSRIEAGDVLSAQTTDVDRLFSGLGMVDAVATAWGSQPIPGKGKIVWFELVSDGRRSATGLSALRDEERPGEDVPLELPPLRPEGIDGGERHLWLRAALWVLFALLVVGVVYAGLWAGGIVGAVWYGH